MKEIRIKELVLEDEPLVGSPVECGYRPSSAIVAAWKAADGDARRFAACWFGQGGSGFEFAQWMGCQCETGRCPGFVSEGMVGSRRTSCLYSNSSGEHGCPITRV